MNNEILKRIYSIEDENTEKFNTIYEETVNSGDDIKAEALLKGFSRFKENMETIQGFILKCVKKGIDLEKEIPINDYLVFKFKINHIVSKTLWCDDVTIEPYFYLKEDKFNEFIDYFGYSKSDYGRKKASLANRSLILRLFNMFYESGLIGYDIDTLIRNVVISKDSNVMMKSAGILISILSRDNEKYPLENIAMDKISSTLNTLYENLK